MLLRPRHAYTQALLAAVPRLGSMKGEPAPRPFPVPEIGAEALRPFVIDAGEAMRSVLTNAPSSK